jgi:hypothetical protein
MLKQTKQLEQEHHCKKNDVIAVTPNTPAANHEYFFENQQSKGLLSN